jgi:hypothetical protein
MKHPSNREFYAYWDARRDGAAAPERGDLDPGAVRTLLGDIFVLSCDPNGDYAFRIVGNRTCALFGRDLKGEPLPSLFDESSRRDLEDILCVVSEEKLAAVAGVTATTPQGERAAFELLFLPFSNRAREPISLTGLLASFDASPGPLGALGLTSWRYMGHPPMRLGPRVMKKLAIARGFMVYEGLI